jgi:hypothetical protein
MEIAPRDSDRGMAKRLLNEVDGRPAVEAVAGVRMTQPVGRDLGREAGP